MTIQTVATCPSFFLKRVGSVFGETTNYIYHIFQIDKKIPKIPHKVKIWFRIK